MINNVQFQTALTALIACNLPTLQIILPAGHFPQTQVGSLQDTIEIGSLDVSFQHDLVFTGYGTVGRIGQSLDPCISGLQLRHFLFLEGDVFLRNRVCTQARMDIFQHHTKCCLLYGQILFLRCQHIGGHGRNFSQLFTQFPDCGTDCYQLFLAGVVLFFSHGQRGFQLFPFLFQHFLFG